MAKKINPNVEKQRNYSIDVMRIAATVFIVFHHYQQITNARWARGINFYGGTIQFGYIVEFFFLLSGYFMYSHIKEIGKTITFKQFYLKRCARLLPLVCISGFTFELLLICYETQYDTKFFKYSVDFWGTVINSLGIQAGWSFDNPCVNNPTWYISVLLLCSIIFYILTYISKEHYIYSYIIMIFVGCSIKTYKIDLPFLNSFTCRGYYAFFFGLIFAEFMHRVKPEKKLKWISGSICTIAIITLIAIFHIEWISKNTIYTLTFIYIPAWIIVLSNPRIINIINYKWIGTLGEITYDIYIWHVPCLIFLYIIKKMINLNINMNSVQTMIIFTAFSTVIGVLSHYFIEKPINKRLNNQLKKL